MKVIITRQALDVIDKIAAFVESKNTPGSGKRYAAKFRQAIKKLAQPNVEYTLCNDENLALFKYNCSHYNDRVIAFRIENKTFVV